MDKISIVNFFLSYHIISLENNDLKKEIKKLQKQLQEEYNSGTPRRMFGMYQPNPRTYSRHIFEDVCDCIKLFFKNYIHNFYT